MRTFPQNIEEKLGFDVVRRRWRGFARSAAGRESIAAQQPTADRQWVLRELQQVEELLALHHEDDPLPLEHLHDLRPILKRAAPEDAFVSPDELLEIGEVLVTMRRVASFFERREHGYELIEELAGKLRDLTPLEEVIDEIVEPAGRVRDSASSELRRLRRAIIRKEQRLRETLQDELQAAIKRGFASEEQPTIRAGRMVIPVRAEAKRKVEGFVQDVSASGQTVYIEPAACLDLNNELRSLESDEKREVERLLRMVTSEVRSNRGALDHNLEILTRLDVLQAKMRLADDFDACAPQLVDAPLVDCRGGRNPVLLLHLREWERAHADGDRRLVPLDLMLGEDYHTLVVTGPNAGGKTVAMKTVGLFALMLAYGLALPVDPKTRFGLFDELIVDIGDEQSIEEDLSTFSSHVSRLKYMLTEAGERSLVLIDEAGTGTDPAEGGALAQAVLEELTGRGARTIATTHHGTLKVFAHEQVGVENGSMSFDQTSLEPTYVFRSGLPGSSYAFEIARRIGLPDGTLERARELAGEEKTKMENVIEEYEARRQELTSRLREAEDAQAAADQAEQRFAERRRKIEKEHEAIRHQALEEAERIVGEANARIERTIREIKEAEAEREATRQARKELEEYRDDIDVPEETAEAPVQKDKQERTEIETTDAPISEGDIVALDEGDMTAEVLSIDDGEAELMMGTMRMRASMERLRKVSDTQLQSRPQTQRTYSTPTPMPSLEAKRMIDLHGMRVKEAVEKTERFVDDALAADLHRAEIHHGRGTGALREAVHNYLDGRTDIRGYEEAPWNQGGSGVTVVRL